MVTGILLHRELQGQLFSVCPIPKLCNAVWIYAVVSCGKMQACCILLQRIVQDHVSVQSIVLLYSDMNEVYFCNKVE